MTVARSISDIYSENESVVALGYCGSVARGHADQDSDLDIFVFWKRPQPDWLNRAPLSKMGADRYFYSGVDERGDALEQYFCGGLKIDLAHELPASQEAVITQVTERHEISPELFKNMAVVGELVALYGDSEILRLSSMARDFPEGLREKAIRLFLRFWPTSLLSLCLRRGDMLAFYSYLVRTSASAIASIAVLNGQYLHPEAELKGALRVLENCAIRPTRLNSTLCSLLENPSLEALDRLHHDLGETLDLIQEQLPGVSTSEVRRILEIQLSRPDA